LQSYCWDGTLDHLIKLAPEISPIVIYFFVIIGSVGLTGVLFLWILLIFNRNLYKSIHFTTSQEKQNCFSKMNHPDIKLDEYYLNRFKGSYTKPQVDKKEISYMPISPIDLYFYNSNDHLDNFFQAKRVNLARSVEDIIDLIEQREKIKERNLYNITLGECEINSKLLNLENWYLGVDPVIDKRRATFERELLDFEKQKRMEETAAWKDILSLKNDLRGVVQELYKEQTKQKLFYGGL